MNPRPLSRFLSDRIQDQSNYLRDSAANTRFELEAYVLKNPTQAMAMTALISVSIGIVVGFALGATVAFQRSAQKK